MHQDLLGYLLGALEPHEMDQVRQALRDDPELQQQLEQIKEMLRPLDEASGRDPSLLEEPGDEIFFEEGAALEDDAVGAHYEPPSDLVSRTMAAIPEGAFSGASGEEEPLGLAGAGDLSQVVISPGSEQAEKQPWSWWDLVFSGVAAMALLGIVLPGVLRGRFEARKFACQDNLREAGVALTQYALEDPRQQLPQLAAEGNEAFAGIYAIKLYDKQLIERMSQILCPSLGPPKRVFLRPPSSQELQSAEGQALLAMQRFSGGSYAYNLGVMSDDRYQSPRYQGRSSFAILGDAPVPVATIPAMPLSREPTAEMRRALADASSVGSERVRFGHAGRGVNLLFEDGHVMFLPIGDTLMTHDHPFLNHRGQVEAGVNADDAALAPSWRPPFPDVRQR